MRQIYVGKNKKKNHGCCVYHDTSLIKRVRLGNGKVETRAKILDSRIKSIRRDQLRLRWGLEPLGGLVKRVR